jgi:hypothetical protein
MQLQMRLGKYKQIKLDASLWFQAKENNIYLGLI